MMRAASVKGRLCSVCGVKPRGAGGRLTRCLDCLKADVDRERQHREAKVREKAKTPTCKRPSPADSLIRVWHADDPERQERERFERKPTLEQMQEAIAAWVYRFRRANDPDVVQRIARQGVARDLTEAAMSHFRIIEGGDIPHIALYPRKGHWGLMKQGFAMLFHGTKAVVTDPKGPAAKFNLWTYIRSLKGD